MSTPRKPRLIYDGECHFCCRWIERWRMKTGDLVEYRSSQEVAREHPDIPQGDFDSAVQWVDSDGHRESGAPAVFAALATTSSVGRELLSIYRESPFYARMADAGYSLVANNRMLFSRLTRLFWGNDVRPPTYATASWLFLRTLGIIYLIAFLSFWHQAGGLIGSQGILPVADFFKRAHEVLGVNAYWDLPSFLWFGGGDAAIAIWCALGVLAALALTVGFAPAPCLIFLWANYLSLTIAGQDFYQFQWDILLLEAGFLAIFLAPWKWFTPWKSKQPPPRIAHFLFLWLLFRLMVASAVVKLSSGDTAWADGSALNFHYFTQPLPTPLAWYAQQFPAGFQWLSVKVMFFIELILPFFLIFPRRLRHLAAGGLIFLQILIALTGNYGFFNLLTIALCLLAVDDTGWKRAAGPSPAQPLPPSRGYFPTPVLMGVAAVIFTFSLPPFLSMFRKPLPWLSPLASLYQLVASPFRTINGYGLFAVMTRDRPEIIVQGSMDGIEWKTYSFRYKPGDPRRAPPWVAPYMPRLDWQMWFAALGNAQSNPWFVQFLRRILEGSPEVLALLEDDPFEGTPPRFVRAQLDQYTFTTSRENGDWWHVEPAGVYFREASLR